MVLQTEVAIEFCVVSLECRLNLSFAQILSAEIIYTPLTNISKIYSRSITSRIMY